MAEIACPQCKALNQDTARYCFECGAPLLAGASSGTGSNRQEPRLEAGKVLQERYRIVSVLGRGGFGAVYRAWDERLNKAVALKENLETTPEAQRQFSREALVLANLYHPNLPRVTDHFTLQGQGQYLVMDFVEGEDLAKLLGHQKPIPPAQALEWILQVAGALEYLHSQQPQVLHRDVKPANIRLTPEGKAMLVDFGLVKVAEPHLKTTSGARAVSPGYAPPEQYGRGVTDARSDIYALAATLYILLTGTEPVESVRRLTGTIMPPAAEVNPAIPVQLSQALERALALDPEKRYSTVSEFKAALQNGLEALRTAGSPAGGPPVVQVVGAGAAAGKAAAASIAPGVAAGSVPPAKPVVLKTQVIPLEPDAPVRTQVMPLEATGPGAFPAAPYPGARPVAPPKTSGGIGRWIVVAVIGGLGLLLCLGAFATAWGLGSRQSANKTATAKAGATVEAQVAATSTRMALETAEVQAALAATSAAQQQATRSAATATAVADVARKNATATAQMKGSATVEARITATAQVQATMQAMSKLTGWPVVFYDDFLDNSNEWSTHSGSTDNWNEQLAEVKDGHYHVRLESNGKYSGWFSYLDNAQTGDRFSISTRMRQLDGKNDALYGLIFRLVDTDNYYLFGIHDDGSYGMWVQKDGKYTRLVYEDFTSSIRAGDWNDLAVVGDGSKFQMYINGTLVGSTTNDWFKSGSAGLYYEVGGDDIGEFETDNLLINAP
jgi:hypothetical protein